MPAVLTHTTQTRRNFLYNLSPNKEVEDKDLSSFFPRLDPSNPTQKNAALGPRGFKCQLLKLNYVPGSKCLICVYDKIHIATLKILQTFRKVNY